MIESYFPLGKLIKTHGTNGEYILKLSGDFSEKYLNLESVFVEIDKELVPFFIEKIQKRNISNLIIRFDDIISDSRTNLLLGKKVSIKSGKSKSLTGKVFSPEDLIGYTVLDINKGEIGEVQDFMDIPNNQLIEILYNNTEILMPYNEDVIVDINNKERIIKINSPEGLIDLYLED